MNKPIRMQEVELKKKEKARVGIEKEKRERKVEKLEEGENIAELVLTLTSNFFREHIQSKSHIQIHHLLRDLRDHATPSHLKMVDFAVFE